MLAALSSFDKAALLVRYIAAPERVSALLEAGASPDTAAGGGSSGTVMHLAARAHAAESLRMLVDAGGDHSAKDASGKTPLFYSALLGDALAVRLLTRAGASVDVSGVHGFTPLMVAVLCGHQEVRCLAPHLPR